MVTAILFGVLLGMIPTIILDLLILYAGGKFLPQYIFFTGLNETTVTAILKLIIFQLLIILAASIIIRLANVILPGFLGKIIGLLGFAVAIYATHFALGMISGDGIHFASDTVQWVMAFVLACTGNAASLTKKSN